MKYFTIILIALALHSCKAKNQTEDPLLISRQFCDCMEKHQMKNGKFFKSGICDSIVFGKSRFFQILYAEESSVFSKETIDSAKAFVNTVGIILDTTCFSKDYLKNLEFKN